MATKQWKTRKKMRKVVIIVNECPNRVADLLLRNLGAAFDNQTEAAGQKCLTRPSATRSSKTIVATRRQIKHAGRRHLLAPLTTGNVDEYRVELPWNSNYQWVDLRRACILVSEEVATWRLEAEGMWNSCARPPHRNWPLKCVSA